MGRRGGCRGMGCGGGGSGMKRVRSDIRPLLSFEYSQVF